MRIPRGWLVGVLAVGVALLALSAVVDSPVTDAAPNVYAGLVVLVVAVRLVQVFGPSRTISTATAVALAVGGFVVLYEGVSALVGIAVPTSIALAGDVALLLGFGLFVYDVRYVR